VLSGLAQGLSLLDDGAERYLFLVSRDGAPWLEPYVSGPVSLLPTRATIRRNARPLAQAKRRITSLAPWTRAAWRSASRFRPVRPDHVPQSDGTAEAAGAHLIHFISQGAFLTEIPSVYHPHDLQHLHLPQNFTPFERRLRDLEYRTFCRQASLVAVASRWVRDDVIRHLQLPPEKVVVVPLAPPAAAFRTPSPEHSEALRARLRLPQRFLFYPAQAWPHKNHITLFRALSLLRDESGVRVDLVCTGGTSAYAVEILKHRNALGLNEQVHWLGYVSADDLRALYDLCDAVVVPTLFEAASAPIWEAFAAKRAVACSNVTSLPDQAGDAALLFDPTDARAIADAIRLLWFDRDLRRKLAGKGHTRVRGLSWDRVARHFRAIYRVVTGRPLSAEDNALLAQPSAL